MRFTLAMLLVGATCFVPAFAQETDPPAPEPQPPVTDTGPPAPLAAGEKKGLQAVVMAVTGRVQWLATAEGAEWKSAAVDDVLDPGARVRTGRRSTVTLRVGHNASLLVDRNTRMVIPEVIQEGETLRTVVQVSRGRVDFKVDQVGLTNDFSVVTPSTTLAVRGTGFGVQYGGLFGTETYVARFDYLSRVELSYFLSRMTQRLGAGAASSGRLENPALNALFSTVGPPPLSEQAGSERTLAALGLGGKPPGGPGSFEIIEGLPAVPPGGLYDLRLIDTSNQSAGDVINIIVITDQRPPPPPPPPPPQ